MDDIPRLKGDNIKITPHYHYRVSDDLICGEPSISKFITFKETCKGYWILAYGDKKWVSKNSRKRFAYPTLKEAWMNYYYRKEKQKRILNVKLKYVEQNLNFSIHKLKEEYGISLNTKNPLII